MHLRTVHARVCHRKFQFPQQWSVHKKWWYSRSCSKDRTGQMEPHRSKIWVLCCCKGSSGKIRPIDSAIICDWYDQRCDLFRMEFWIYFCVANKILFSHHRTSEEVKLLPISNHIPINYLSFCSQHSQMPKVPISYRLHKKYYLEPMVSRSCGFNSTVTYKWTVNDYLDKSKSVV